VGLSSIDAIGLIALFTAVSVGCKKDGELSASPEAAIPAQPKLYDFWRNIVSRFDERPILGG
jgi:hypothetical protein